MANMKHNEIPIPPDTRPWHMRTRARLVREMVLDLQFFIALLNKPPVDPDWQTRLDDNNIQL